MKEKQLKIFLIFLKLKLFIQLSQLQNKLQKQLLDFWQMIRMVIVSILVYLLTPYYNVLAINQYIDSLVIKVNRYSMYIRTYLNPIRYVMLCCQVFDTRKKTNNKKDIDMSLYALSGIDSVNGLNFAKVTQNIKTATAKGSEVVKKAAAQIPAATEKIKQGMVTAGLAAPRAAFLALMELNFTGMASDFQKIIAQKGDEGIKWWVDFGGDRTAFTKSVNDGAKRKAILSGVDEERAAYNEIYKGYSGDGVQVGVVVATTAATAAPILIKAADIVKKLKASGIDPAKLASQAKQAASTFKDLTGKDVKDVIF